MKPHKIIHVIVNDVLMCFDLNHISKVLPLVELNPIPGSGNYIVGLMNLYGNSIPIIDLASRVGLQRKEIYSLNSSILLCQVDNKKVGYIVDKIIGLEDVDVSTLQLDEKFLAKDSFFKGSFVNGLNTSLLINLNNLLTDDMKSAGDEYESSKK